LKTIQHAIALAAALMLMLLSTGTQVHAEMAQADEDMIEEVVTIGTRAKPRSTTDSTAPVDVVTGDDFMNQGGIDTSNLLRNLVPSFNVNDQPISDAATLVRPANLRGLAPDHTLVMVNGRRRHRAAVITWLGNGLVMAWQMALRVLILQPSRRLRCAVLKCCVTVPLLNTALTRSLA
jgi:iron complex outermembrane receptor protein